MKIEGSVAMVTGGASGLGLSTAQNLIKKGSKVLVLDLPKEESEKKIQELGPNAHFFPGDITQTDQIQSALETLDKKFGTLQILVNCAGIAFAVRTLKKGEPSDLAFFSKTLEVNLTGTFNVCRLAAAFMAKNNPDEDGQRGVIINTASIAAYDGQMGQTAYAASKGGLAALTLPLARDLSSYGIRALTIAPGIFDTPLFALLPEPARESLAQQTPFPKRLGKPPEFAALVMHIVENTMLNGEVIRLDGALRMGLK